MGEVGAAGDVCGACGRESRHGARFCDTCGAALALRCPSCATELRAGARFCDACGHAIGDEAPGRASDALIGERKQVTVLFADIKGSMDLAARVDAEVWQAVIRGLLAVLRDGVERYEGTLNKSTGDGAMALFGAPVAHEDHAVRACHAALHLRDELAAYADAVRAEHGLDLQVRLGLNSGEVVAGAVAEGLHMDALGNAVNIAARMEGLAEPDKPYMTADTAALVRGLFELEDMGRRPVKGVSEPVHAYALLGAGSARSRLEAAAEAGLSSFVGRDAELAALDASLTRAHHGGQVVGVVSEPGGGKSRLCHEFAERCSAQGIPVTFGGGLAHRRQVPLLPVVELLRQYFGIADEDDEVASRAKVADRLQALDTSFAHALPVLLDFLGVPDPDNPSPAQMAPEARQRALFAAISRLVRPSAGETPGVIVVEDLHWLDPGSEAFLSRLVDSLPGARTLLIVNFRPEYRADWMRNADYQQLPLAPLPTVAVGDLVRDLIGDDPSVDGLDELVSARTAGNPFFVEEVVRRLVETRTLIGERGAYKLARPIDQIEIPATVQAVLAARLDRLSERDKAVLQAAAVIGREFSVPVLRRVTELDPTTLAEAMRAASSTGHIHELRLYPEAQYAFKHPLTVEVAYRSQLGDRRRRTHAAVARAIESEYPDRRDELAAVVAHHWEQAGRPVDAAQWAARAALWAGRSHPSDALRHWRRVRELAGSAADDPAAAGLVLAAGASIMQAGWRLGLAVDEVDSLYRDARRRAEKTGNKWAEAAVHAAYSTSSGMVGEVGRAVEYGRLAYQLATDIGDRQLRMSTGLPYWEALAGDLRSAYQALDEGIALIDGDFELGRSLLGFSVLAWSMMYRALLLGESGRLVEAKVALADCVEAVHGHDTETYGWALSCHGLLAAYVGDASGARDQTRESVAIAERLGSSLSLVVAYVGLAMYHLAAEEWDEAMRVAERALEVIRERRTGGQYEPGFMAFVALAHIGMDRFAQAAEIAASGLAIAVRRGVGAYEPWCRLALGRALAPSRPAEAVAELERALDVAGRIGSALVAHAHVALADVEGGSLDYAERTRHLEEACRLFEAQGATGHLHRVRERLAHADSPVGT